MPLKRSSLAAIFSPFRESDPAAPKTIKLEPTATQQGQPMDMMRFTVAPGFDIKCDILVPCLLGLRRAFQPFDQFARELFRAHARRDLIDPVAFPTIVGAGLRVQGIPTTGVRWCSGTGIPLP